MSYKLKFNMYRIINLRGSLSLESCSIVTVTDEEVDVVEELVEFVGDGVGLRTTGLTVSPCLLWFSDCGWYWNLGWSERPVIVAEYRLYSAANAD